MNFTRDLRIKKGKHRLSKMRGATEPGRRIELAYR